MTRSSDDQSMPPVRVSCRTFLSWSAPAASPATSAAGGLPVSAAAAGSLNATIEQAKAEGELSIIALPDDWANYQKTGSKTLPF